MAIPLGEQFTPGHPVVKRTAIGQKFVGAVVNVERRDRTKRNPETGINEVLRKADGKARQELIITCLVMPGSDAPAGIGDEQGIPESGDTVRLILKGKAFADWIQAEKALGRQLQVGDCVKQRTTSAQRYNADGDPVGDVLTTQTEVDAVPRSQTIGIYAELKLEPGDGEWIDKAEAAYRAATAVPLTGHQPQQAQAQPEDVEEPW
jgi:hypothetical protein